jgi:hypothetical protein
VLVTITCCGALVVPVSRDAKVRDAGANEAAGAEVEGGDEVVDGVQPASEADVEVEPSLTVTRHVDEL